MSKSLAVTLALVVGTLSTACSGGAKAMSADAYFHQVAIIEADNSTQATDASAAPGDACTKPIGAGSRQSAACARLRGVSPGFALGTERLLSRMGALRPPLDLVDLHQRYVASLRALSEELRPELTRAATPDESGALFDEKAVELIRRLNRSCIDLQTEANRRGITVDLLCADDGE